MSQASSLRTGTPQSQCATRKRRQCSHRKPVQPCNAAPSSVQGVRIRNVSKQMQDVRSQLEESEDLRVLMAGLRGANLNQDDFAADNVTMQLVEVDEDAEEALPKVYDPEAIAAYWERRPVAVARRVTQLMSIGGDFITRFIWDLANGRLQETEVERAIQIREILTSLGPAYIKLGQALSIRPDILSPAAMNELQKLCDKVPSFPNELAMATIENELGRPWYEIYAELSPDPVAAASLGQVYRGKLQDGQDVAVKVQRPYVLETVTVDLFIIRSLGVELRKLPQLQTDVVALLDEWAARFFEELDYVREGNNATKFAEQMREELPQIVVPKTFDEFTSRRVLTTAWLEGEKLSQSKADDVGTLVNIGVICYLKQLLDTGFFHADSHPGNLIRTPDGRLAILDFGLMTQVDENIKFGMIEAISHLIHRDYEAIVQDFVTLDFIPPGTDLTPILPVLAKVFDQALEGGGAKSINFQELAADLAQITFDYPFRIPPYFALIIRAISLLEGIALTTDPDFAIVDEAYPYIAKRLLTDDSPRLREALRYMVYGKENQFNAERIIDLLDAFEEFKEASNSGQGDLAQGVPTSATALTTPAAGPSPENEAPEALQRSSPLASTSGRTGGWPSPFEFPPLFPPPLLVPQLLPGMALFGAFLPQGAEAGALVPITAGAPRSGEAREALKFLFAPEGQFFREFLLDEVVKSIDAMSREQLAQLVAALGWQSVRVPILLPGATGTVPLSPPMTLEDQQVIRNTLVILNWLVGGSAGRALVQPNPAFVADILPYLPNVATSIVPEITQRLASRITARALRQLYGQ